mmetsp:Transcript_7154/g.8932  ORF Transcript_7154/g.8932 Transcript_7154/m.8932 type:complete len:237 (-) Transcript_7154:324-1034(-)
MKTICSLGVSGHCRGLCSSPSSPASLPSFSSSRELCGGFAFSPSWFCRRACFWLSPREDSWPSSSRGDPDPSSKDTSSEIPSSCRLFSPFSKSAVAIPPAASSAPVGVKVFAFGFSCSSGTTLPFPLVDSFLASTEVLRWSLKICAVAFIMPMPSLIARLFSTTSRALSRDNDPRLRPLVTSLFTTWCMCFAAGDWSWGTGSGGTLSPSSWACEHLLPFSSPASGWRTGLTCFFLP